MIQKLTYILTIFAAVALITGCGSDDTVKNVADNLVDSSNRPDSEVEGAVIEMYDRDRVTAQIVAETINKFEAKDSTMGYVLDIVFYDSLGNVTTTIVGDSGIIREGREFLEIFGNVVLVSDDSTVLETDFLTYNQRTHKLRTDAFVKITDAEGNVITGWGLEADRDPIRYRILRQVSGTVKDAEGYEE